MLHTDIQHTGQSSVENTILDCSALESLSPNVWQQQPLVQAKRNVMFSELLTLIYKYMSSAKIREKSAPGSLAL